MHIHVGKCGRMHIEVQSKSSTAQLGCLLNMPYGGAPERWYNGIHIGIAAEEQDELEHCSQACRKNLALEYL